MQRELLDFVNFIAALEQTTRGLMPKIVKMQVVDAKLATGSEKRLFDARRLVGKDERAGTGLSQGNVPSLLRILKSAMICELMPRVFQVADESRRGSRVVVDPSQSTNLTLTSGRIDGEPHDVSHRNHGLRPATQACVSFGRPLAGSTHQSDEVAGMCAVLPSPPSD